MVGQLGSRGLATWARRGHSARARELKVSHDTRSRGSLTIHRDILTLDNLSLRTEWRCERKNGGCCVLLFQVLSTRLTCLRKRC